MDEPISQYNLAQEGHNYIGNVTVHFFLVFFLFLFYFLVLVSRSLFL